MTLMVSASQRSIIRYNTPCITVYQQISTQMVRYRLLHYALLPTLQSAQHDVSMKPPALEAETDLWRDSVPQLMTIEVLEAGL
jgi:hypothetical protein